MTLPSVRRRFLVHGKGEKMRGEARREALWLSSKLRILALFSSPVVANDLDLKLIFVLF